ncbi:hypothetical protein NP493_3063g00019 [Ridgeia piscesae]|uniref:Uncharacterized protein n=1 Tax=Ridgeia piscesae TaxID=27915 RepID=A0AAD9JAK0_RIDPI|nr:hypothetical protein NP493_3063g00019 [Ridgeia piscesae]
MYFDLHNFTVGLTNIRPTVADGPGKSAHKVCLVYNGEFKAVLKTLPGAMTSLRGDSCSYRSMAPERRQTG